MKHISRLHAVTLPLALAASVPGVLAAWQGLGRCREDPACPLFFFAGLCIALALVATSVSCGFMAGHRDPATRWAGIVFGVPVLVVDWLFYVIVSGA